MSSSSYTEKKLQKVVKYAVKTEEDYEVSNPHVWVNTCASDKYTPSATNQH